MPESSTGRQAREAAVQRIPFAKLNRGAQDKLRPVVTRPSLYRQMTTRAIQCDPEMFVFLVRYPEIVVNMWQLMGVTKVAMNRTAPHVLDTTDGAGTDSRVQLVYGNRDVHVLYAEGAYEGPLFRRKITGQCVLVLTARYGKDTLQRDLVETQLDVFIHLDNVGAELLAKTIHPLIGRTADKNFSESMEFVGQVSRISQSNGPGMQRLVPRLTNVDPIIREQFEQLVARTGNNAVASHTDSRRVSGRPVAEQFFSPSSVRADGPKLRR